MTPIQKFVYVAAKDHHEDDYDAEPSSSVGKAHGATRGL